MFIKRLQNVSLQNVHFSLLGYTRLQRFIHPTDLMQAVREEICMIRTSFETHC
jgi:hypothetical protein